jgi:hypothetical protein
MRDSKTRAARLPPISGTCGKFCGLFRALATKPNLLSVSDK